ncbi:MAG: PIN domain-containing protein [Bacteroidia bacterium]|nr:PIN domain-containing protein [Bacteroidia bacterium]
MNIFLDANILVSVLNKEYPLFTYSARVLSLADNPRFQLFTSPICLAIAFYFSEKKSGAVLAKKKIEILCQKIEVSPANESTVISALHNNSIRDFEDGLEYYSATAAACTCIITEDLEDFFFSDIEVLDSLSFIKKYVMTV